MLPFEVSVKKTTKIIINKSKIIINTVIFIDIEKDEFKIFWNSIFPHFLKNSSFFEIKNGIVVIEIRAIYFNFFPFLMNFSLEKLILIM